MLKGDFCRWTGRILGIVLVVFIVVFFVAHVAAGDGGSQVRIVWKQLRTKST
jgi:hypothetical protein